MCGRYTLATPDPELQIFLDLDEPPQLQPRYNIAPTQSVSVLRRTPASTNRRLETLRWGLIPSWAKDSAIGARMINARSETAAEKPSFRVAFRRRRCLLPADGFYEWQRQGRVKQPYYIRLKDGPPFALAGLWEQWHSPDGSLIETCTILTTEPNDLVKPLHNRMPVLLSPDVFDLWLDPAMTDPARIQPLLRPCPPEWMLAQPVTTHVNSPRNDDPACIQPVDE